MLAGFTQEGTFTPDDGLVLSPTTSRQITLLSGQNLRRGAVLGRITANDKYVLATSAAGDGSQIPAVILAEDTDASSGGDKSTVAYFGGTFDENCCLYGTGVTPLTAREPLRDVSILLQSSLKR